MTMGGFQIMNGFSSKEIRNSNTQMWELTQKVVMTPTTLNDGQKICCEMLLQHPVCLTLKVQGTFYI